MKYWACIDTIYRSIFRRPNHSHVSFDFENVKGFASAQRAITHLIKIKDFQKALKALEEIRSIEQRELDSLLALYRNEGTLEAERKKIRYITQFQKKEKLLKKYHASIAIAVEYEESIREKKKQHANIQDAKRKIGPLMKEKKRSAINTLLAELLEHGRGNHEVSRYVYKARKAIKKQERKDNKHTHPTSL